MDIIPEMENSRYILILLYIQGELICTLVDCEFEEFVSFCYGNPIKKSIGTKQVYEENLFDRLPCVRSYRHIIGSIFCSAYKEGHIIHIFITLATVLDYMGYCARLPSRIIYPANLLRQAIHYLTLARVCANYFYNRTAVDKVSIPVIDLPCVKSTVIALNTCPFCGKRMKNRLRGVFRHIRMKHGGAARRTVSIRYKRIGDREINSTS